MQELLHSQIQNIHRSSKKNCKAGVFHNKLNHGHAQFKFKAATWSAEVARQGWIGCFIFYILEELFLQIVIRQWPKRQLLVSRFSLFPPSTVIWPLRPGVKYRVLQAATKAFVECLIFFVVSNQMISPNSRSKQIKVPKQNNGLCLINQHQDSCCMYAQVKFCLDWSVIICLCSQHNMTW